MCICTVPPKPKFLVLDDDNVRHQLFLKNYSSYADIIAVYTVEDAIAVLTDATEAFAIAFLDHDLGENQRTGYDLVKYIITTLSLKDKVKEYVVHSLNPVGSNNMATTLTHAGFDCTVKPAAWLCE